MSYMYYDPKNEDPVSEQYNLMVVKLVETEYKYLVMRQFAFGLALLSTLLFAALCVR